MISYHDDEWGVPVHDDCRLFEFLALSGAQAGLSWETVLKKRDAYREAFDQFDPATVAQYESERIDRLLANAGIIRNRQKIQSAIQNARAVVTIQDGFGSLDNYLWRFVDGVPIRNAWPTPADVPTRTPVSDALSLDLKQRGFSFVGSTICYAFMESVGMVNDHIVGCFRWAMLNSR
jgi:DNA-3-methyladenine glycosylase I